MSSQHKIATYRCGDDCVFEGCPGHTLGFHFHHTSGILTIKKDGEKIYQADYNEAMKIAEVVIETLAFGK